jgi:hypothetical protein
MSQTESSKNVQTHRSHSQNKRRYNKVSTHLNKNDRSGWYADTRKDIETTTTTKTKSDFVFPAEDLQIEKRKQRAERKETVLSSPPLHPRRQNITKYKVLVTNLLTTRSSKSSWTRNRREQKARGKQETEKKLPAGRQTSLRTSFFFFFVVVVCARTSEM